MKSASAACGMRRDAPIFTDRSCPSRINFIPGIVYLADAVGTQTRPWRSAAYPWASGSAASPAARRAHRTARRLPSRDRDAAPSAGCDTIPHDVDVDTQIEAAAGGQGSSSRS
jgi:hypothetical protein